MKKLLFLFVITLTCQAAFAQVNMPEEPIFTKPAGFQVPANTTTTSTQSYSVSNSSVSSLAQQLAKAANNDSDIQELYKKLLDKGVSNIKIETHTNGCPYRKGIPPITIGGRTYTGQKCTIVRYTYNGQSTGIGACSK